MNEPARSVQRLFASVAPRYDLLNHLLSLNLDRRWRRLLALSAAERMERCSRRRSNWCPPPYVGGYGGKCDLILDLCAGTGDLSLALAREFPHARIAAIDFVEAMLARLNEKSSAAGETRRIRPVCGDALQLPFADATFDLLAVAFGLRNLSPVGDALAEMARVLLPGGCALVLEFALPKRGLWGRIYRFYFFRVLPKIGRWISGTSAYSYLPASVALFPEPESLGCMMKERGFAEVEWRPLAGGAVTIHSGFKTELQGGTGE